MTNIQELERMEQGIGERMLPLQDLVRRYDEMKAAAREYKTLQIQLEEVQAKRRDAQAIQAEQRIANITQMYVRADASVTQVNAIAGPVSVDIMTKHGDPYTRSLISLEEHEKQALIRNYWEQVPMRIRVMGDTPYAAITEYIAARLRGYMKG